MHAYFLYRMVITSNAVSKTLHLLIKKSSVYTNIEAFYPNDEFLY